MLFFLYWTWWLTSNIVLAAPTTQSIDEHSNCTFTIRGFEYHLCPVLSRPSGSKFKVSFEDATPPTRTTTSYYFSLRGPLGKDGTLPAELQCPEGTWICLYVTNTRPSHPSEPLRVLQVVPVAGVPGLEPKVQLGSRKAEDPHPPLQITLHGGSYTSQSQKASLVFLCDHDAIEPTEPEFMWKWNGTHTFSWKTKHACPTRQSGHPPDRQPDQDDKDPPANPPADPDSESEPEDVQNPIITPPTVSTLHILILLSLLVLLFRVSHPLLSRSGRKLASLISTTVKSKRTKFRPTPSRLVLWAREAAPISDDEINSTIEFSSLESELTPLTPNTRNFGQDVGIGHDVGKRYGSVGSPG